MKRYEPIPTEETKEWGRRFAGKSLDEVTAMIGSPLREHGPEEWTARTPGKPVEIMRITRTLEFAGLSPSIKTVLVHMQESGLLAFTFRGRELPEAKL
jgi:hypothetical protein